MGQSAHICRARGLGHIQGTSFARMVKNKDKEEQWNQTAEDNPESGIWETVPGMEILITDPGGQQARTIESSD